MEQQITAFIQANPWVFVIVSLWTLVWKGVALWKAAGKKQISWFILLLLINSVGLLEIGYIYYLYRFELGSSKILTKINTLLTKK